MNITIEFDGSEFRSLRREIGRLMARRFSTEYFVLKPTPAIKSFLDRQGAEYAECEEELIVFGSTAEELADVLSLPLQSALQGGKIRQEDPVSRQFLGALIETLLPPAEKNTPCVVVASAFPEQADLQGEDLDFLLRLVKLRGYQPQVITPGLALILSEGNELRFSGVAVHLGMSHVDICVMHQTREMLKLSLPRGGLQLERQLAISNQNYLRLKDGREVLDTRPIRQWRLGLQNLNQVSCPLALELRSYYGDLILQALQLLQKELSSQLVKQLPRQLPLVIGGPLAMSRGLEPLFQQAIHKINSPLQFSSIRSVHEPSFPVMRGGLIAGEMMRLFSKVGFAA